MTEQNQKLTELVSLLFTVPTIYFALLVVLHWTSEAFKAFRVERANRTAGQWFLLGVDVGFIGSALDNIYWGVAWSMAFVGHPDTMTVFMFGALSNIFARQLSGMYAAYCHIRASYETTGGASKVNTHLILSAVAGFLYVGFLLWVKAYYDFD